MGTHSATFDARKGRLSVPAPFRAALAKLGAEDLLARRASHAPCVEFWPRPTFLAEVERRIAALDPFAADYDAESRRLVARVYPVQPDAEGRAGLPRELLDRLGDAALGTDIVFTGRMKFFQAWDAARFAALEAADEAAA